MDETKLKKLVLLRIGLLVLCLVVAICLIEYLPRLAAP